MTTLFMVSQTTLPDTLITQDGDSLVLLGDAVALALDFEFVEHFSEAALHVLSDDMHLRGLSLRNHNAIKPIDYSELVNLTMLHHQIQSC